MHQEERVLLSCCLLLHLVLESCYCVILNSITLNQTLKDGDVLVSGHDGDFALGFFSPGNITNRYVGIWYNKVPIQTIVWVANRQTPVIGATGVLSIDRATGNLVLTSGNETKPIWSTSVPDVGAGASTSSAKLLNIGNLLLVQGSNSNSNNENVIWQSFDHPTNTLLPYMRLGVDLKRGLNWSLTSWKTYEDPGIGQYSYGMDLSGQPQVFFANGSKRLWRSGPWDGTRWNGVPEMVDDVLINATYIQNSGEITIMYGILNASLYSRQVVNETTGTVERLTWHSRENRWVKLWSVPVDRCDFYAHCGDYGDCMQNNNAIGLECSCLPGFQPKSSSAWYLRDVFEGCERKPGDNVCNNGEGFVPVYNAKLPDTSNATVDLNLDLKACAKMCAKNCSCTAYASATINEGGCMTWYGPLIDVMKFTTGGQTVYIRVDEATLALYSKKSNRAKKIVIIVVASLSVVLLGISLACWLLMKRRRAKAEESRLLKNRLPISGSYDSGTSGQEIDESQEHADLPLFDLRTIFAATDNFSLANKLGEGGFGSVYKGRLENGQEIAVKRLGKNSGQGIDEFKNEVTLIAKLQHRSLVRLLGCSIKQDEKMLIYEYLPNKGLDSFLFNKEKGSLLDWRKRFEIIMGIVRGMIYLHRDSRLRIIHRDLKASNVLLDADMNPKISDFGMAKMFGGDELEANTKRVVGTYGYMAPEYAMEGLFSIKSDVFSFGVLLLEIISGKKNSSYYQDNCVNLIGYVWDLWRFGKALEIVDSSLGNSYQSHEVLRCIQVGLLCVQEHASDRPTMSEVSSMLSKETRLPSPGQPAFIFKGMSSATNSSSTGLGNSVNDVTLTVVEAR